MGIESAKKIMIQNSDDTCFKITLALHYIYIIDGYMEESMTKAEWIIVCTEGSLFSGRETETALSKVGIMIMAMYDSLSKVFHSEKGFYPKDKMDDNNGQRDMILRTLEGIMIQLKLNRE